MHARKDGVAFHGSDPYDRAPRMPSAADRTRRDEAVGALSLDELYAPLPPLVEETLVASVKALASSVPAPRDDPFYGLDRLDGSSTRALERLTGHGDFRKYVHVLDAGAGLGSGARWLARRFGCRVLLLDAAPARLALAARLTSRAGLGERMRTVAGRVEAIPLRAGVFTQIWSVETLHHVAERDAALRELFRVLRPGSTLALQEIVRRSEQVPVRGGPWRHGTEAEYREHLAAAGFREIVVEDVTDERAEVSPVVLSARERWLGALHERLPADAPWLRAIAAGHAAAAEISGPDYRVVQLFARRPST